MDCKVLEKQDLTMMLDFVDDENTKYNLKDLNKFIQDNNCCGFIAKDKDKIVGFATGYVLLKPDGRKAFYLDTIDVMPDYQNNGCGTRLTEFVRDYANDIGCYEMFLITNRSNISACKCYEKAGGANHAQDEVVYVYDFNKGE